MNIISISPTLLTRVVPEVMKKHGSAQTRELSTNISDISSTYQIPLAIYLQVNNDHDSRILIEHDANHKDQCRGEVLIFIAKRPGRLINNRSATLSSCLAPGIVQFNISLPFVTQAIIHAAVCRHC